MSDLSAWHRLSGEVDQGKLKLKVHRDALDEAIKLLQDYIDDLDGLRHYVAQVAKVSGFGGFQIGLDLADKFTRKGSGEGSIRDRLKELTDEAKAIQDVIRKAAIAYAETDAEYADVLEGIQP